MQLILKSQFSLLKKFLDSFTFLMKLKTIYLLLICLWFNPLLHAQQGVVDTLLHLISIGTDDKDADNTIDLYERLSSLNLRTNFNEVDSVGKLAYNNRFMVGQGLSYLLIGRIHYSFSEFYKAQEAFSKGLAIFEKLNNKRCILNANLLIANTHIELSNYKEGLNLYSKCKTQADSLHEVLILSKILNNIGLVYLEMNDTKTALNYLHQSLKIKLQLKNKRSIANTYNNIGELYLKEGNTEQANDFFNKALNIRRELNDMPAIAETMFNFGCLYQQNSETEKAIQSFNEVLNIYKSTNNKLGRANTLSELGKTYMLIDSLSKAKIYFEEALSTIKKENIPLAISLISKDYAILLAKMNEFDKAYMLLQQSNAYFDTISERQPGINLEYYSASISKLRTQLSVQEKLTNKYYRIIILLGSCILLVILVFAWKHFATNNKRKNELKSLHNQIEELQQQKSGFDEILQKEVEIQTITLQNEISERLKIDAELKKALKRAEDANYLKNAFLSNISHEIRTPLNGIIGFAALLETELSRIENQELYDYANGISQSGERLLHLLTNLIDISRLEANDLVINLEEVDLPSILNDATTIFKFKANEKGIRFNLQGNPCPLAIADSNNLMRVLSDLIDNSLKYTEKGFINISCGVSERSNELFIRVKDTGIGIDPSYLPSIFEAFRQESLGFSRAYQGAGLGLPLAKRLVELMKGRIEIVSEKGLGTTVTVFLKQSSKSSALKTPMPDTALISSIEFHDRPINILIIEDDRMNRMVLKKMLENVGELTLAIDGDNALDLVKKNLSKNFVFDIMLVDINLPSPWDGVKLLKKIKQDYKQYTSIPFIAQTAYAMSGDKERFLESGFDDYISKPVSKNHLLNIIQKHIKSGN